MNVDSEQRVKELRRIYPDGRLKLKAVSKPQLKDLLGFSDGPGLTGALEGAPPLEPALPAATGPAPIPPHAASPAAPGIMHHAHSGGDTEYW